MREDIEWRDLYNVATGRVAVADQARETRLYNFLIAITVLLLCWASVFTKQKPDRLVLSCLAFAGALFCLVLLGRAMRGNQYFEFWHALARKIELSGENEERLPLLCLDHDFAKHLHSGSIIDTSSDEERYGSVVPMRRCTAIGWLLWLGAAWNMMLIVPIVFLTLFVLLFMVSLFSRFTPWTVISPAVSFTLLAACVRYHRVCGAKGQHAKASGIDEPRTGDA